MEEYVGEPLNVIIVKNTKEKDLYLNLMNIST